MKKHLCLIIVAVCLLFITACGGNSQAEPVVQKDKELEELITQRCTSCHTTARITSGQPKDSWPSIVDRMISKGSGLTTDQRDELVTYLQEVYGK